MAIQISFVMAIHNRAKLLERTLEGYRFYAPHHGTELVVADYGSTDNVKEVLRRAQGVFEKIRYLALDRSKSHVPIHPKYNNPSVALNVAIRMAQGPLLIMSPPECYPLKDNIHAAQTITDTGTIQACVFGRALGMSRDDAGVLGRDGWFPRSEDELRERVNTRVSVFASERPEMAWGKYGPVHRAVPFFMAFRKIDHETVNGFDEEHARGYGGEDSDYTKRLRFSGAEHVWDDRCAVIHQWHPPVEPGPRGAPSTIDGFRTNGGHEPGPRAMVIDEVMF
jgi:glycosyltransferase involved in cell wall biosynthesis